MAQGGTGHVNVLSRSNGRSATAAAAYRAATLIHDQRTGLSFDYRRKQGVEQVLSFHPPVQLAPGEAKPAWMERLEALEEYWNLVEQAERRKNSRVAREFLVPLPHELTPDQRVELAQRISDQIAARYQVAGTACIHAPDKGGDERNFHVHILFPTRRIDLETGELGEKTRELDDKKTGPEEIVWIMEMGESEVNWALEAAGIERRVDWRSIETRHAEAVASGDTVQAAALNYVPQVHEGNRVTQIRRDAEKRAAVSGASVVDSLMGECDLIAYNEGAKAMKAAALEHSEAMLEAEEEKAKLIEAEAIFEEARRKAELARVGLGDSQGDEVGYQDDMEVEPEAGTVAEEKTGVIELTEYRENLVSESEVSFKAQKKPEIFTQETEAEQQLAFDLVPALDVQLVEAESSVAVEKVEEHAEDDEDWLEKLDAQLANAELFSVSPEEEMRRVLSSTVGKVIRTASQEEPDEDIEELRQAMGMIAVNLAKKTKTERDEVARKLHEIMEQERLLQSQPVPNVPPQTLAGLLRDFLASIPGLGWIGVSRHTRALQEQAKHEKAQEEVGDQREVLELKKKQLNEPVVLATRQEAEELLKQRDLVAKAEESLPRQRKENDDLLEKLELEGQVLKSAEKKGLSSIPGFGWVGAKKREEARVQIENHQQLLIMAKAKSKELDAAQQVLDDLYRSIYAAEQRPGMAEQLQLIKNHQNRVEKARAQWKKDRDAFSRELVRSGNQLDRTAQREIERGNQEFGARHEDDRKVMNSATNAAKELSKAMRAAVENLNQLDSGTLTDAQVLDGFRPTTEQLSLLRQAQEQTVALPLLADQLKEQREQQRRAERIDGSQEHVGRIPSKSNPSGPKM